MNHSLKDNTLRKLDELLRSNAARRRKRRQEQEKASYARYSSWRLQDETSIEDQNRETCGLAGVAIKPELQFADKGISGAEHNREGLYQMLEAAADGEFSELYVFSLSRLAREYVFTMSLLKWLVYECGVRVRSKVEGIDTNVLGWELHSAFQAMFAEQYRKELQENSLRGLLGNLASFYSLGDYCFGFDSHPDPNGASRKVRGVDVPKRRYAIHPENANWVKRIFHWFVRENRDIQWIVRELNELQVPRDHRATNTHWDHSSVRRLLESTKYIGLWTWGRRKNCRSPLTGIKFRQLRTDEEILKWNRQFPELRIIDDETFHLAHLKLKANADRVAAYRRPDGKLGGAAGPNGVPRHLLQGLLHCSACGSPMHVTGPKARYLRCRGYRDGLCDQRSQLPRDLAEQEILQLVSNRILRDDEWTNLIVTRTIEHWRTEWKGLPNDIDTLRRRLRECESGIENLLNKIERSKVAIPSVDKRLEERLQEKQQLEDDLANASDRLTKAPDERGREDIVRELGKLDSVIRSQTPAAAVALADLLRGPILVSTVPAPRRMRKAFQLAIPLTVDRVLYATGLLGSEPPTDQEASPLTLDVERPSRGRTQAQEAWRLLHEGKAAKDIALELGVSRSRVTVLLQELAATNRLGLSVKQLHALARSRRAAPPKLADRLEPRVMELFREGHLIEEIATELGCSDATVHKAIANWHRTRGLAVPDGRTRRKQLTNKVRRLPSDGATENA
ncbi:recombinase family protein [Planctomyces sp. SH-PL14]|uniref:recombinase family protein n=1 Tax=Planctomyces sp. SH-PL14 TaxID=1632864 RepID=UPI00078C960F|nr:recombinase family protein [Planctomyces sp. SH-PL14]AMV19202.1 hypothetical protein VT03_15030 [Planctomyces sp. SH-PL14]